MERSGGTSRARTATSASSTNTNILTALRKFGWGTGFRSPFANPENKELEDELERKQRRSLILRAELEDSQAHGKDLRNHLLEAEEDINFTGSLVNSKRLECESEQSQTRFAERVLSCYKTETKRKRAVLQDYQERNAKKAATFMGLKAFIEETTLTIESDMELLKIFEGKKAAFDEQMRSIHKYRAIDEQNLIELETKEVDLGARNKELKIELDQCAMNSNKFNEQYSRLCIEFRKVYKQKKELAAMWARSLNSMKGKDLEMKEVAEEYYEVRATIRGLLGRAEARDRMLQLWREEIREADFQLSNFDRRLSELREKMEKARQVLLAYKDEYLQVQVIIQNTGIATETARAAKLRMVGQVSIYLEREKIILEVVGSLRRRKHDVCNMHVSKDEYLKELDNLMGKEEKERAKKEREVERVRMFHWTKNNEKAEIEIDLSRKDTRSIRIKSSLFVLEAKEWEGMALLAKKQSNIYRLDLDTSQLEMRISKLMNESVDPRFFMLQERHTKLRAKEAGLTNEQRTVIRESERVNDLTHAMAREIQNSLHEKETLQLMLYDINLCCEKMEKALADSLAQHRSLRIEHSLEVVIKTRLQKNLKRYKNMIFSLSEHRAAVQAAVKERKSEIGHLMTLLIKQSKQLISATSKLGTERVDVQKFTDKLKGRFELTTRLMSMSASDEVDGTSTSFSYQIRKAVREREGLTNERKGWEARIVEAERELEALKNSLQVIKAANAGFRNALTPADPNTNLVKHCHDNEKKGMVIRNRCKGMKSRLKTRIDALTKEAGVYKQEIRMANSIAEEKEKEASCLHVELVRQKDRMAHWDTLTNRQLKILSKVTGDDPWVLDVIGKVLKRRMMTEKYKHAMSKIHTLITNRPAVERCIEDFLRLELEVREDFRQLSRERVRSGSYSSTASRGMNQIN